MTKNIEVKVYRDYINAGLSALPASRKDKKPLNQWFHYQFNLPKLSEITPNIKSNNCTAIAVICGVISKNLEVIDFDNRGESYSPFIELLELQNPELKKKLVIETSQSGGYHILYRCEERVEKNQKLASREEIFSTNEKVMINEKEHIPAKNGKDKFSVILTLIETRGQGGLIICAPTEGYNLIQGEITNLPTITFQERNLLLNIARSLNEQIPETTDNLHSNPIGGIAFELLPGADFNLRGDPRPYLESYGWKLVKSGAIEHWKRPGKDFGVSATMINNHLFVFSSNAQPFEPNKCYQPFAIITKLVYNDNFSRASKELFDLGFGKRNSPKPFEIITSNDPQSIDPGHIPEHLLIVPGFIGDLSKYMCESAPHPNKVISFIGALALLSFLCGRKIKTETGLRPNLYLLGLASSSSGKDFPRKVIAEILRIIGKSNHLGDGFASGEGLEDFLALKLCLLYQTDEIDNLLLSIKNSGNEPRYNNIMSILLKIYSSSESSLPRRALANRENKSPIIQPHLTIFGTAIPKNYYEALSEKMLTNGLFGRMLVFESYPRVSNYNQQVHSIPDSIISIAKYWMTNHNFHLSTSETPEPLLVRLNDKARVIQKSIISEFEKEYKACEKLSDETGMTVWGRANENMMKLAMLYAVSKDHTHFVIDEESIQWASELVRHQIKKMLYMASQFTSDSPFEKKMRRVLDFIPKTKKGISHSQLLKKSKLVKFDFESIIETLEQRGDISKNSEETSAKKSVFYVLRSLQFED